MSDLRPLSKCRPCKSNHCRGTPAPWAGGPRKGGAPAAAYTPPFPSRTHPQPPGRLDLDTASSRDEQRAKLAKDSRGYVCGSTYLLTTTRTRLGFCYTDMTKGRAMNRIIAPSQIGLNARNRRRPRIRRHKARHKRIILNCLCICGPCIRSNYAILMRVCCYCRYRRGRKRFS